MIKFATTYSTYGELFRAFLAVKNKKRAEMPSAKIVAKKMSGREVSEMSADQQKKRVHTSKSRWKDRSSSSATTVSSLDSETNGKMAKDVSKSSVGKKKSSVTTPSGHEKKASRNNLGKSKKIVKSKSKKCKQSEKTEECRVPCGADDQTPCEESNQVYESIPSLFNETLRWSNARSDSEEEEERLRVYKENRRKRYTEAMQVKIVQRMSGLK